MDLQIKFYKAACFQRENGFDIPVFRRTCRYQYGQVWENLLCGIVRFIPQVAQFFKPVVMNGVQTRLKSVTDAIKESVTVTKLIKSTHKPTVDAVFSATVD